MMPIKKQNDDTVMMGCWQIGGIVNNPKYLPSKMITIKDGPFRGRKFPSAAAVQANPISLRLPPLARYTHDGVDFMPFLLYDQVTIDKLAFECLLGAKTVIRGWKPSASSISILEKLASDGFVRLEDYSSKLNDPEVYDLVDKMTLYDLSDHSILAPCMASLNLWIQFYKDLLGLSNYQLASFHNMLSSLETGENNDRAYGYLYECVADINRVLVLSQVINQPVYEWEDYNQYYRYKFIRTGQTKPSRPPGQTLQELFNVFIPNFQITSYSQLSDIKGDRRFDSVRKLTKQIGNNPISKDLVIQAHQDVLVAKKDVEVFAKYTGLVGFALNLLPGPVGDVFQLAANSIYERWCQRNLGWQTFFVERAVQYHKQQVEDALRKIESQA